MLKKSKTGQVYHYRNAKKKPCKSIQSRSHADHMQGVIVKLFNKAVPLDVCYYTLFSRDDVSGTRVSFFDR